MGRFPKILKDVKRPVGRLAVAGVLCLSLAAAGGLGGAFAQGAGPFFAGESAEVMPMTGEAQRLYEYYGDAVYQVQVIDLASGKKTSIGSAFQFGTENQLATNYHVIAEAVQRPSQNRIEFVGEGGAMGSLDIVAIDVVHDLAVLRKTVPDESLSLSLATSQPGKGARIYALGNPHDIGFTIIEGTYNGIDEAINRTIHFSGALNPGMSGGPAIDQRGQVVGVNVSTAGNQISFLIPVENLRALSDTIKTPRSENDYDEFLLNARSIIETQLVGYQDKVMSELLASKWENVAFGPVMVPGRISPFFKCWGGVGHKEGDPYQHHQSTCSSSGKIYLEGNERRNNNNVTTGQIIYRYDAFTADADLSMARFYALYRSHFVQPLDAYRNTDESNVTNFKCDTRFVTVADGRWKTGVCVRQYKKYPALYDMHMYMALVDAGKQGMLISLVNEGVSRENALRFMQKFLSEIRMQKTGTAAKGG